MRTLFFVAAFRDDVHVTPMTAVMFRAYVRLYVYVCCMYTNSYVYIQL